MQKISLAQLPTGFHSLPRLQKHLNGPEIWIKRDDNTGLALGGNKARKLEYLLADALVKKCDVIITAGGIQSNHARMTAAAAASLGLECHLVLRGVKDEVQGNLLLDEVLGAHIHLLSPADNREERMVQVRDELRAKGRNPYVIGIGGSNALGSLGYVDAVQEIKEQGLADGFADEMVVAVGSGGTYAGIIMGLKHYGLKLKLQGIAVDDQDFTPVILGICQEGEKLFGMPKVAPEDIHLDQSYLGECYGKPSDSGLEAIELLAKLEGILLDPVYTGKAMAGLIDRIRKGFYTKDQRIVFWHTGGAPALFAFGRELGSK